MRWLNKGQLQLDLFDERNLFEFSSPDYPGERLVACRNAALADLRAHKRESLLCATEKNLAKIKARVDTARLAGQDAIGVCVGKVINQYKVAKHFELAIDEAAFSFQRRPDSIAAEAALDGIYIIRTSVPVAQMSDADCVRNYKSLANVERAFRSIKTMDLKVRPIHHRLADRVRSHIFLCMLAYYVEWHMREAWRELMFADTDQHAKAVRDPVAPATRSAAALTKVARHTLDDDSPAHSSSLMAELSTITRNTCRTPMAAADAPSFEMLTIANPETTARDGTPAADLRVVRKQNLVSRPNPCGVRKTRSSLGGPVQSSRADCCPGRHAEQQKRAKSRFYSLGNTEIARRGRKSNGGPGRCLAGQLLHSRNARFLTVAAKIRPMNGTTCP